MNDRILLFRGADHALDFFSDHFRFCLEQMGYECLVYDIEAEETSQKALKSAILDGISYGFCFNNLGLSFARLFSCPFYDLIVDHPFHFHRDLSDMPENGILLCIDRRHVEFVRRFYPMVREVRFFPHAGVEAEIPHPPLSERPIPVLYCGSLPRNVAQGLIPDLSAVTRYDALSLCKEVLTTLSNEPKYTTEETIERYFKSKGIEFDEQELLQEIVRLRFLEAFAVSLFREQAVLRLVEKNIPVTVYGRGWEETPWSHLPALTLKGMVTAKEVPALMNQAKIVLNTLTWFKAGAHERIFNAQLNGAVSVTDPSDYLLERFSDGNELSFFSLKRMEALPDLIRDLLSDEKKAQELSNRGYLSAKEKDTWGLRLKELLS